MQDLLIGDSYKEALSALAMDPDFSPQTAYKVLMCAPLPDPAMTSMYLNMLCTKGIVEALGAYMFVHQYGVDPEAVQNLVEALAAESGRAVVLARMFISFSMLCLAVPRAPYNCRQDVRLQLIVRDHSHSCMHIFSKVLSPLQNKPQYTHDILILMLHGCTGCLYADITADPMSMLLPLKLPLKWYLSCICRSCPRVAEHRMSRLRHYLVAADCCSLHILSKHMLPGADLI